MTSPASSAQDPYASGLRLLFLGAFSSCVLHLAALVSYAFSVLQLLPAALLALGLLRFASRLENEKVRRGAAASVMLIGVQVVLLLGSMLLSEGTEGERGLADSILTVVITLAFAAFIGAMLLTVWQGCLLLEVRPPRPLFLAIAGLTALEFGGMLLAQFLSDHSARSTVLVALTAPFMAIHVLLAGTFFLTHAEVLRTRAPQPEVSEWKAAASGLTLWLRGLYALAVLSALSLWPFFFIAAFSNVHPLVHFTSVFPIPLALISMSLFQYARVPEVSGAREPAYIALSLFVLAFSSFGLLGHPMLEDLPLVLSLVAMGFLIQSLMRAAPALADTTRHVGRMLIISMGVTVGVSFFKVPRVGPLSILYFVAGLANLVYGVRFLFLVSRLRYQLGTAHVAGAGPLSLSPPSGQRG
ncbi:hypothetical protein [Archangium lansingense]|uniref:Uncharacterized protein n=1 Tax=Archangium lansingense TaxID=2995310 RepID=A0ABT4ADV6_9BACT|nr:hypothetical protein [Archangium lansinium]MCY1079810.1 hypothetical protein [Archangium lansinium]